MTTSLRLVVKGQAWIGDNTDGSETSGYWAEGETAELEVERSDINEIRIGIQLGSNTTDDATFYLTDAEAARLAFMLGKVVLE